MNRQNDYADLVKCDLPNEENLKAKKEVSNDKLAYFNEDFCARISLSLLNPYMFQVITCIEC